METKKLPGYQDEKRRALALHQTIYNSDSWKLESESHGLRVSKIHLSDLSSPFVRADKFFKGEKVERILSIIRHPASRALWDEGFAGFSLIDSVDMNLVVAQTMAKPPFPVSARDAVVLLFVECTGPTVDFIGVSIEHNECPPSKNYVRAESLLNSWKLTQTDEGVHATFMAHVNPKGSIPTFFFNVLLTRLTESVPKVYDVLKTQGPSWIYLVSGKFAASEDLRLLSMDFSHPTKFEMHLEIKDSDIIEKGAIYFAAPAEFRGKKKITVRGDTDPDVILDVDDVEHHVGDMTVIKLWHKKSGRFQLNMEVSQRDEFISM